jgi:lysophospholipase L1-like esterase
MTVQSVRNTGIVRLVAAVALTAGMCLASPAGAQTTKPATTRPSPKFCFTPAAVPGFTQVKATDSYTDQRGYGFEKAGGVKFVDRGGSDVIHSGYVTTTSATPFAFSIKLPEGNYDVTFTIGDSQSESTTTVKAELRRLMIAQLHLGAGEFARKTITVNIRTPLIAGTNQRVALKAPRETTTEAIAWDDKLTLEFDDKAPAISAIEIAPSDGPTVYLMGDSTMCDQSGEPFNSWGQSITNWFRPGIAVSNQAESGDSLPGSVGSRLTKMTSTMKKGDYLFVQFGHNDMKSASEPPARYEQYLTQVVNAVRAHNGTPVIVTPVSRKSFGADGKITDSFVANGGSYVAAAKDAAKINNAAMIDLNGLSAKFYEALGRADAPKAFANPNESTHHSDYGSYEISKCMIQGIIDAKLPLADWVVSDWKTFDPSKPDPFTSFTIPRDGPPIAETPLGS